MFLFLSLFQKHGTDFWVASANAIIHDTSIQQSLELPLRLGRVDSDICDNQGSRLPLATGCSEVENTFLNKMGISWTDAVALLGAHTLGRGSLQNSGFDGTWVANDNDSTIFDKSFYTEGINRAWRPRDTNVGTNDWTWGGNNRGVMFLNTDVCLMFDIDDSVECCTNVASGNCRNGPTTQCSSARPKREEAVEAFETFANVNVGDGNLGGNQPFYNAFRTACEGVNLQAA